METVKEILGNPIAGLFLIIALGSGLGRLKIASISLGASGVLFAGIVFGHFGISVPREFQDLGIILFVYSIGLQAGPRFFNQFRQRGTDFAKIGIVVVVTGAAVAWLLAQLFDLSPALTVGMYAGAMTSTPGLAAAMDAASDPTVGVGFGLAYPFGVVGVVLLVQLLPRFLGIDLTKEEGALKKKDAIERGLQRRQFCISNPACIGKTLADLQIRQISEVNVTRILRNSQILPARHGIELELGDKVLAVGRSSELEKLKILFGEEIRDSSMLDTVDVIARDAIVSSEELTGKTLAELAIAGNYGVVISRVFREDLDFVPTGQYVLEVGDLIRVTGSREDCERFVEFVGQQERRIHETNVTSLAVGLFLGIVLSYQDFTLPGGATFRLGLAGGPLFVSLLLAHFGRIGGLNIRTPRGAKYILQQLGLTLFLAGAGTAAGTSIGPVLLESGVSILLAGALVTIFSATTGLLMAYVVFKMDFLTVLGAMSGAMTSTPALGVVSGLSNRNEPVLAYTGVYPVALIVITIICQFLFFLI